MAGAGVAIIDGPQWRVGRRAGGSKRAREPEGSERAREPEGS
jgi:hypothetical protein